MLDGYWLMVLMGILMGLSYGMGYSHGERKGIAMMWKEYRPIVEAQAQRLRDVEYALQVTFPSVFGQRKIQNVELN